MTGQPHSRARVVMLLALTFSAGLAIGIGGSRLLAEESRESPANERAVSVRDGDRSRDRSRIEPRFAIERHADELELTEAQRAQIEVILADVRAEMDTIMSEIRPRFREVYRSARADIESLLTPDQAHRYGEILDARRRESGDDGTSEGPEGGDESE